MDIGDAAWKALLTAGVLDQNLHLNSYSGI